jgi:hypothetical protein
VKKAGAFSFELTREGIEARLSEMDQRLGRLRSLYESFFAGVERMPPNTARRDMNRMMLEMQQCPIANSSLRFRFQSISQKWVLLITYWNRTMREIEAGTYRRDLARAQRHMAGRGGFITEDEALALGIPKNRVKAFVAHQQISASKRSGEPGTPLEKVSPSPEGSAAAAEPTSPPIHTEGMPPSTTPPTVLPGSVRRSPPPIPVSARLTPPPIPTPLVPLAGVTERDFAEAYTRYRKAHEELGTADQAKTLDRVRQQLSKALPRIMEERGCSKLRIEVAVEAGKVHIRAWPENG